MAATALDIITRSLQDLRVLRAGGTPKAADSEFCLGVLNDMLAEWANTGVDLALETLAASDVIDVPDNHLSAIRRCLSLRIADAFGAQMSPMAVRLAQIGEDSLRGYHFAMNDLTDDNPLARNNLAATTLGSNLNL